jgi:GntR family transcriptional regulator, transcriptional repressor for pyruvate dehydrogenase complex
MPLKPVEKILVSDGIMEQIRDLINSGEFRPGEKLPSEMKMTQMISVSRSSLREALNALIHLGYLRRQNKGLYVMPETNWKKNLSFDFSRSQEDLNVAEMIEVRKIVETELCALAAKRAAEEDIKALEECLEKMRIELNNPAAFTNADHHFHLCIAKAAKNRILADFVEKVRDIFRSNIALIVEKSSISKRSLRYHDQIFEAIRTRDSQRARKIMAKHLADIEKEFVRILYQPSDSSSNGSDS